MVFGSDIENLGTAQHIVLQSLFCMGEVKDLVLNAWCSFFWIGGVKNRLIWLCFLSFGWNIFAWFLTSHLLIVSMDVIFTCWERCCVEKPPEQQKFGLDDVST